MTHDDGFGPGMIVGALIIGLALTVGWRIKLDATHNDDCRARTEAAALDSAAISNDIAEHCRLSDD